MNIEINKDYIESLLNDFNSDIDRKELEFIYKKPITEDKLMHINKYFTKTLKIQPEIIYILDVNINQISISHRTSYISQSDDILSKFCLIEKDNSMNQLELEYKHLVNRYDITKYNIRINLKDEYIETDKILIEQFYGNYNKFKKNYRLKKRYKYKLADFTIDISVVKSSSGYNIINSNIRDTLEHYEIEIECNKKQMTLGIIKEILKLMMKIIQINDTNYFITDNTNNSNILKNYNTLLKNIGYNNNIGPKPITLTKKTINNMILSEDYLLLLDNYSKKSIYYKITEKADGLRYFMYINELGQINLINDNNNIIYTGLQINTEIDSDFVNCVLDGEYIYYKNESTNNYIYEYKFFDIYILNSKTVYDSLLDVRIDYMNKLDEIFNSDRIIKYLDEKIFIKCSKKAYFDVAEFNTVLNNPDRKYEIDGVIFMPFMSLHNIKNIACHQMLKYKQDTFNSIDVHIKDNTIYCGAKININVKDVIYVLSELHTFKPYIYNIHKPDFIYTSNNEPIEWKKLNNKIIEIRYDKTQHRFIFMTIRHEKMLKYNKTKRITANNIDIVQDIITNTFNPIDPNIFSNLTKETIESYKIEKYYTTSASHRNQIRKINNLIKGQLIEYSINILEVLQSRDENFKFIKVLEFACGRAGDLYKWLNTNFVNKNLKETGGVQFILGIDNDANNIEYYNNTENNNNARARFLKFKNEFMHENTTDNTPNIYNNNSCYFITGDMNKYDSTEETVENVFMNLMNMPNTDFVDRKIYDKKLLDDIYKFHSSNEIDNSFNIYEKEQFEIISCQFAIHYFDLKHFTHLVNLFLKPNGLFICTYMEQEFVEELMGDNDNISGEFWSLEKSDNPNKIRVKFETLEGDYMEENFVKKQDLLDAFATYSIIPYNDSLTELNINSQYDFKNHIRLKSNNNPELNFSRLYSYIIFEKNPSSTTIKSGVQNLVKQ